MTVSVPWFFITVPRVGLQCVIVLFPDHTDLLLGQWVNDRCLTGKCICHFARTLLQL